MDNQVEISIYVNGGTVLPCFMVRESSLADAIKTLASGEGTITALNGMVVKASQVTAFQVIR